MLRLHGFPARCWSTPPPKRLLIREPARWPQTRAGAGVEVQFRAFADSVHSFVLFGFLSQTDEAL
ncbi:MAG TPA: hypothetical protein VID68_03070 [Solirubrobacteraceae bacterium]